MSVPCPSIDWLSFFAAMDDTKQQEFEADLSARDISLGEYMEIVEQAALEATARGVSRGCVSMDDQELLTIAASMLTGYVARKRMLAGHAWEGGVARLREAPGPAGDERRLAGDVTRGILLARRIELRAAIHRRIEAIKRGGVKP